MRTFSCVEAPEVGRSVNDDTLHWHVESQVKTLDAIGLEDLGDAVSKTGELSFCWALADVGSKSCSGEVQRIDEAERRRTSGTTRCEITSEITPELCFLIHTTEEDPLVLVFEGEVEGLGGEVTDHVGQVAPPEGDKALLFGDSHHAVNDSFVLCLCGDLFAGMLDLETKTINLQVTRVNIPKCFKEM